MFSWLFSSSFLFSLIETIKINKLKSIKIIGPDFSSRDRTPTVSFVHKSKSANEICKELAKHNICAWDGHFYALKAIQKLGLEKKGGVTRLGISVYNQSHEIDIKINRCFTDPYL